MAGFGRGAVKGSGRGADGDILAIDRHRRRRSLTFCEFQSNANLTVLYGHRRECRAMPVRWNGSRRKSVNCLGRLRAGDIAAS